MDERRLPSSRRRVFDRAPSNVVTVTFQRQPARRISSETSSGTVNSLALMLVEKGHHFVSLHARLNRSPGAGGGGRAL